MKITVSCLASILMLTLSSCKDLNDTNENGVYSLYFRAKADGAAWAASADHIGASPDNNGAHPLISIHGDLSGTGEYFLIKFSPMMASDTTIADAGLAGMIEFHESPGIWISTEGTLTIHKGGTMTKHEYSGSFSGTFQNTLNNSTIPITDGVFRAQGTF